MKKIAFSLTPFLFLLLSCHSNKDTSTESLHFTLDRQNWKSSRITQFTKDIGYSAVEVPIEYYLQKTLGEDLNKIDSVSRTHSKDRIIEFEFQHVENIDLLANKYTYKSYDESVQYMAFDIEDDFLVVTSSKDTISCAGAHFERNFKVAPYKKLILYFTDVDPDENLQLVYNDQLFGNGLFKFNFQDVPVKL